MGLEQVSPVRLRVGAIPKGTGAVVTWSHPQTLARLFHLLAATLYSVPSYPHPARKPIVRRLFHYAAAGYPGRIVSIAPNPWPIRLDTPVMLPVSRGHGRARTRTMVHRSWHAPRFRDSPMGCHRSSTTPFAHPTTRPVYPAISRSRLAVALDGSGGFPGSLSAPTP